MINFKINNKTTISFKNFKVVKKISNGRKIHLISIHGEPEDVIDNFLELVADKPKPFESIQWLGDGINRIIPMENVDVIVESSNVDVISNTGKGEVLNVSIYPIINVGNE